MDNRKKVGKMNEKTNQNECQIIAFDNCAKLENNCEAKRKKLI